MSEWSPRVKCRAVLLESFDIDSQTISIATLLFYMVYSNCNTELGFLAYWICRSTQPLWQTAYESLKRCLRDFKSSTQMIGQKRFTSVAEKMFYGEWNVSTSKKKSRWAAQENCAFFFSSFVNLWWTIRTIAPYVTINFPCCHFEKILTGFLTGTRTVWRGLPSWQLWSTKIAICPSWCRSIWRSARASFVSWTGPFA